MGPLANLLGSSPYLDQMQAQNSLIQQQQYEQTLAMAQGRYGSPVPAAPSDDPMLLLLLDKPK